MLTTIQIDFLNQVCPNIWSEENGIVNVNGNVNMFRMNLTKIPVQFGQVTRDYYWYTNNLTSLEGAPRKIGGSYSCLMNRLTSLKGGPKEVGEDYSCSNNQLANLIGAPEICNTFWCNVNQLTSLKGCPRIINRSLDCCNNPNLYVLYGIGQVKGDVIYDNHNDLNEWIIQQARKNIFMSYENIAKWIKDNNRLEFLLNAQPEIHRYFSNYIINALELNLC